ncbi:hypothetical protein MOSE0_H02872 [Monosporozyma servazzii]
MFNAIGLSNVGTFPKIISNTNDRYYLTTKTMGINNNNTETKNNESNNISYGVANVHSVPIPIFHNTNITYSNPNYNIPYPYTTASNSIDFNYIPPVTNICSSSVAATTNSNSNSNSNSSSSNSTPIVTHVNNNNNNNDKTNAVHSIPSQSMINPFQRKYETLLPASKPTVSSNNIENDIKTRLNASALKFLSGCTQNRMDGSTNNTYQSSLASSNGSYSSLSESYYQYNNGIPVNNFNGTFNFNNDSIDNSIHIKQEDLISSANDIKQRELNLSRNDIKQEELDCSRPKDITQTKKRPYKKRKSYKRTKSIDKPVEILEHCAYLELRRRHICQICNKGFTTSGHLARHNRIHTGERNHVCPFKGCYQKFSRQDNCLQHYKTHLKRLERSEDPISGELSLEG